MVGSRTSCSAEEAQPPGHHARTSHLQSMCDAGPIRSMGPVSLLKVKPAAVTCVLTSQWAIEIARGPEQTGHPLVNRAAINSAAVLAKVVDDLQERFHRRAFLVQ